MVRKWKAFFTTRFPDEDTSLLYILHRALWSQNLYSEARASEEERNVSSVVLLVHVICNDNIISRDVLERIDKECEDSNIMKRRKVENLGHVMCTTFIVGRKRKEKWNIDRSRVSWLRNLHDWLRVKRKMAIMVSNFQ